MIHNHFNAIGRHENKVEALLDEFRFDTFDLCKNSKQVTDTSGTDHSFRCAKVRVGIGGRRSSFDPACSVDTIRSLIKSRFQFEYVQKAWNDYTEGLDRVP